MHYYFSSIYTCFDLYFIVFLQCNADIVCLISSICQLKVLARQNDEKRWRKEESSKVTRKSTNQKNGESYSVSIKLICCCVWIVVVILHPCCCVVLCYFILLLHCCCCGLFSFLLRVFILNRFAFFLFSFNSLIQRGWIAVQLL